MVVLDTNIIIDHLRLQGTQRSALMRIVESTALSELCISTITVQELYEGKSSAKQNAEMFMLATINPLRILPYSYEVAKLAGEIARDIKRPIQLADAAIAA